jgi:hypothetical protein
MKANVLVIANRTAASPDLLAHLREVAERRACRFELLIPPTVPGPDGRTAARQNLDAALAQLSEGGLDATGEVGTTSDPVIAAIEAFDPGRHDEIVVSTLPESSSRWLGLDGPARIGRATGALVHHVVSAEAPPPPHVVHVERKKSGQGVLSPLVALGYGRPQAPR